MSIADALIPRTGKHKPTPGEGWYSNIYYPHWVSRMSGHIIRSLTAHVDQPQINPTSFMLQDGDYFLSLWNRGVFGKVTGDMLQAMCIITLRDATTMCCTRPFDANNAGVTDRHSKVKFLTCLCVAVYNWKS